MICLDDIEATRSPCRADQRIQPADSSTFPVGRTGYPYLRFRMPAPGEPLPVTSLAEGAAIGFVEPTTGHHCQSQSPPVGFCQLVD